MHYGIILGLPEVNGFLIRTESGEKKYSNAKFLCCRFVVLCCS